MKKAIKIIGVLAYIATFIIASAGALNFGFVNGEGIYTVFGVINLLVGAWITYKYLVDNKIV